MQAFPCEGAIDVLEGKPYAEWRDKAPSKKAFDDCGVQRHCRHCRQCAKLCSVLGKAWHNTHCGFAHCDSPATSVAARGEAKGSGAFNWQAVPRHQCGRNCKLQSAVGVLES